jgi:DNA processing protein
MGEAYGQRGPTTPSGTEVLPAIDGESRDLLTLHLVPGLGPKLTAALLERFGTPAAVLSAPADQLRQVPHVGDKLAAQIHQAMRKADVVAELEHMARHQTHVLVLGTPTFPASLATIAVPPRLLYVRGKLQPCDTEAVAIVGSRHCTPYGRRIAARLAADLSRAGFTIISGLARGIDGAAHRGCLQGGGRTIAVLAGGLGKIYPPEHKELAEEVRAAGALVSESAMLMEPMAGMFPARNRIISGLSRAVIVVEANERSGALITAHHAAEQGREVFAVPGPVDSPASLGSLRLIRQGAKLIRHADDVLEDLRGIAPLVDSGQKEVIPPGLDDGQRRIWELLADGSRHIDEMARELVVPIADLGGALMLLEMKKVVRRLPGNLYERR